MTRLLEAKPFIIAEVGSNWSTLSDCIESIGVAATVGADAVKFQAFNQEALFGYVALRDRSALDLPISWLPKLKEKADACGIEFMCTAFSPELVAAVDPYVEVHKVASSDLNYPQLLQALAKTGKRVLLSTGASTEKEIEAAFKILGDKVMSLYCVAAYPANFVDFDVLIQFDGLSDHTLGITAAVEAARQGTKVIEKHFTAFPDLNTPDRPHSVTPDEFKLMVDYIRGTRESVIGPTAEESAMLLRFKRRLIATKDINLGDRFQYGINFGAYRSLEDDRRGMSPFQWEQVQGKTAKVQICRGKGIAPGDVEHGQG